MKKELISLKDHHGATGTGTQAVKAGNLIFVGGQMSLDDQGQVVGTDITTQAKNAFEALKRVLAAAGATMADVVKHNIYFSCDGDDQTVGKFLDELDAVRLNYFSDPGPTTTETNVGLDREGALNVFDCHVSQSLAGTRPVDAAARRRGLVVFGHAADGVCGTADGGECWHGECFSDAIQRPDGRGGAGGQGRSAAPHGPAAHPGCV